MQISTIRPGIMVALKTTVTGNVKYKKDTIEAEHVEADGAAVAVWQTEKIVNKPDENKEALQVRGKCRTLIVGPCAATAFGLLCPESKANELGDAIVEAQNLAAEFNEKAEITRISVNVMLGRVAQDDVQAVAAISSEVRDFLGEMEAGLQALDVTRIRAAAQKARDIGSMLSYDANERVMSAVKAARSAARKIVKAAEVGAAEIDQATLTKIRQARTSFLDVTVREGIEMAPEVTATRALDLTRPAAVAEVAHTTAALDLGGRWRLEAGDWFTVYVGPRPSQEEARAILSAESMIDIDESETVAIEPMPGAAAQDDGPRASTRQLDLGIQADTD